MATRARSSKLAWTLAWCIIVLQATAIALLLWMHESEIGVSQDAYPNETPQDAFLGTYLLVQLADRARDRGDWFNARRMYAKAGSQLDYLRLRHPEWEPAIVEYRWNYVVAERDKLRPDFAPFATPLYAAWTLVALAALLTSLLAILRLRRMRAESRDPPG